MSTPARIFASYFAVGLVLMVIAIATRGKEKRAQHLDFSTGSEVDAGLMIFIVLLWPVWLVVSLSKNDDSNR